MYYLILDADRNNVIVDMATSIGRNILGQLVITKLNGKNLVFAWEPIVVEVASIPQAVEPYKYCYINDTYAYNANYKPPAGPPLTLAEIENAYREGVNSAND